MVNYCCVYGCGRNSRLNKHLNYYSLPKDKQRLQQWLKAAGRDDLVTKDHQTPSHRVCSRHFKPACFRYRLLSPDAVPTLCLPGMQNTDDDDARPLPHGDIVCDGCGGRVVGRRYACVLCPDYDLCQRCEMHEAHPDHYMLRIPKPMKFKRADDLLKKWREFIKAEHLVQSDDQDSECDGVSDSSDDDEPITKYARNYDSGVDLSEDVKKKIRKEVKRALKSKPEKNTDVARAKKRAGEEVERCVKKPKTEIDRPQCTPTDSMTRFDVPEVAFADVNEMNSEQAEEFKPTILNSLLTAPDSAKCIQPMFTAPATLQGGAQQPIMQVKLSDDLTELMIEVTSSDQKTVYKYTEV